MNRDERLALVHTYGNDAALLRKAVVKDLAGPICDMANRISGVLGSSGKLLIAGNGGSAADASHFAAEMIVRLTSERSRQSLPALCLNVDPSVMTAAANDFGYESIFSRQVEGLGNKGDLLIVISTSGNSPNLIKAAQTARDKGILATGLLGGTGGELKGLTDSPLIIPHMSTQRIQEEHIFIIHLLVELVESDLIG
jgi:D-sedoheptulose 7-phosphate isomerase